jgi:hypothetical protein
MCKGLEARQLEAYVSTLDPSGNPPPLLQARSGGRLPSPSSPNIT